MAVDSETTSFFETLIDQKIMSGDNAKDFVESSDLGTQDNALALVPKALAFSEDEVVLLSTAIL
jgi:hypothetical protein